jgi:dTDP-glucose pyrophosphorylase
LRKIKVGVIPAAGRGNRIAELPLTRILPKPMLPLLNKPILEYIIENMKNAGIEVIYLIVGHKKEVIQEYFQYGKDWNVDIYYVEQKELKGIAHAIGLTQEYINEPFLVFLGDDLTITDSLQNIVGTFFEKKAWAVEGIVYENDVEVLKRTCCITLDNDGKIKEIIEKPDEPKSNLRGIGIYLFDPIIFEFIKKTPISPKRNEIEISDTIGLVAMEGKAYGALIDGINININTFKDLMKATNLLINFRGGLK